MGNTNTSGFQEVDSTNGNSNHQEKSPQPQESFGNADYVEAQNEVAAVADESRGNDDDGEMVLAPNESSEGETEFAPLVDCRTAEMASDEAGGERSETEQLSDHEEPTNLNTGDSELNKLDFFKEEGEDVILPVQEIKEVNGHTLEEDSTDLHTGTRIVEESSDVTSSMREYDQGLEACLSANQDELDVPCTVLDDEARKQEALSIEEILSKASEEKLEAEDRHQGANCLTSERTPSDISVNVGVTGSKDLEEMNCGISDTMVPESETSVVDDSVNSESDHSVLGNNMILATSEETCSEPAGQSSEGDGEKHDPGLNESSLDLAGSRDSSESDATQDTAIRKEELTVKCQEPASEMSCQFMEAQVTEYLEQEASEESCDQELEDAKMVVPELGNIPSELHDLKCQKGVEEGEPTIWNRKESIVKEMEKLSAVIIINNAQGAEWQEQYSHQSIPLQPEESISKDNNHQATPIPDDDQAQDSENRSNSLLNDTSEDPDHSSASLAEENSEPDSGTPNAKHQELETCYDDLSASPNKTQTSKHRDKFQSSASVRNSAYYDAQEATGRFSTGSNPDSFNNVPRLLKSPSFGFDLRIDPRSEESDRTPLLFKTTGTRSFTSPGGPFGDQPTCQYSAMEVEEEKAVIRTGRSDSEPFLGFPNGEAEEISVMVVPKKQEIHNSASKSTKDKHTRRSSFFGGCICCTTSVIN